MLTTSICLSNDSICVVLGNVSRTKIKIQYAVYLKLPNGVITNGMIANRELLIAALKNIYENKNLPKKDVRFLVNSGSVLTKLVQVPVLPHKNLIEFTKSTFSGVAPNYNHLLYDYAVVSPKTILCSAMERDLVESYANIFNDLGIKLYSLDIPLNCIIKISRYFKALINKTYVISVLEGNSVFSVLFVNGEYTFSNVNFLMSDRGTPEWSGEIVRVISSLIQFNKSQKTEHEIGAAYFCGLSDEEQPICQTIISELGIESATLPTSKAVIVSKKMLSEGFLPTDHIFAIGNLVESK
ncbi:MAG: type IV pilus biogenesis protein PilM [Bacillota bacterium]|jgi:type IV pilus assembly protein PilM